MAFIRWYESEVYWRTTPFGLILFRAVLQAKYPECTKLRNGGNLEEFVNWFNLQVPDYTVTTPEARKILESVYNLWENVNKSSN
jgi:hypothetical protein